VRLFDCLRRSLAKLRLDLLAERTHARFG